MMQIILVPFAIIGVAFVVSEAIDHYKANRWIKPPALRDYVDDIPRLQELANQKLNY